MSNKNLRNISVCLETEEDHKDFEKVLEEISD